MDGGIHCSFCGRSSQAVNRIVSGPDGVYICDRCVHACLSVIEDKSANPVNDLSEEIAFNFLKPQQIHEHLNQYVVGQEEVKKPLSVGVYNHYKRVRHSLSKESDERPLYGKSNILLLGSTGSGKTLMAKTLASILDVPFAIADATTLTEAGYVGEDVENILVRLLQAADYNTKKAEIGIIYIDEVDKIRKTTANVSITRDVSGEGVQQALLKIIEGAVVNVPPKGGRKHPSQDYVRLNTENILFIAGGAFVGLEDIIRRRLGRTSIGFNATEDQRTQEDFLLDQAQPEDLVQFGLIPEFIGRFNVITHTRNLSIKDLCRVLTEPKDALITQYKNLFKEDGVELLFDDGALEAIAEKAQKMKTGARALRTILEKTLQHWMYHAPTHENLKSLTVTREAIEDPQAILSVLD